VQLTQADSEIEEEHLVNFVVNSLGDEFPIGLGENVKVTSDELYEVVADLHRSIPTTVTRTRRRRCISPRRNEEPPRFTPIILYVRVRNKHTLAVRQLEAGETTSDVLAEFLGHLDVLDLRVKAVYLDRGFYNSTCLELLYAHNYAYAMSIVKWGETIQDELSSGWSRVIEHQLAERVTFPVFIDCVYQRARYYEHGVTRHG